MNYFLSGVFATSFFASGLYFMLFWQETKDRLFLFFTFACWALAVERLTLAILGPRHEFVAAVYLVRLVAFTCLIVGIVYKNTEGSRRVPR